jgi:hypothetical protein
MQAQAVIVPDIRRFSKLPGAFQYDATRRVVWYSCPCGCGAVGDIPFSALADKPYAQRHEPSVRDEFEIGIKHEAAGNEIVHWHGTLKDGVFEWIDNAEAAQPVAR